VFPLVVLFGLCAVDRARPNGIRNSVAEHPRRVQPRQHQGVGLVALVSVAASPCEVPIANSRSIARVPLVVAGRSRGLFSGLTGLATGVVVLCIARSGNASAKR
jgi:hypothetical protein